MKKQTYKSRWTIHPYRKDKRSGALNPVKKSNYAKQLFSVGAGWKETSK